jgi:hypothetical protein
MLSLVEQQLDGVMSLARSLVIGARCSPREQTIERRLYFDAHGQGSDCLDVHAMPTEREQVFGT